MLASVSQSLACAVQTHGVVHPKAGVSDVDRINDADRINEDGKVNDTDSPVIRPEGR